MIKITQIKLPIEHDGYALRKSVCSVLRVKDARISGTEVIRRAVDARHKDDLKYVYTVLVSLQNEDTFTIGRQKNVSFCEPVIYRFPYRTDRVPESRPVIVGSGPAGLFCALFLAENGFRPLVLERGQDVEKRTADVERFWNGGKLDPSSNVQFGEGGAGTFSDGKLATGISDKSGRISEVMKTFCRYGGPEEILFDAKPHLGTDLLKKIVKNMRTDIIRKGGTFRFGTCVTDLVIENGRLKALVTRDGERIDAEFCVLAPGHSARDTFLMLKRRGAHLEAKPFSAGVRVIHDQKLINRAQWGEHAPAILGAADYKLSARTQDGRGVYSFCMCPGGYVVNASSEEDGCAVNGMSYAGRDSGFANSAVVSGVDPADTVPYAEGVFCEELSGLAFQRRLETLAYRAGEGAVPAQTFADFRTGTGSIGVPEDIAGCAVKGLIRPGDLSEVLPENICRNIIFGMERFGQQITGFDAQDVPLLGVESRTSSPVRILRDEHLESNIKGLFPCGEGAGYAGGITSAAVDGIRAAEAVSRMIVC